jgi:hypothetical protein
MLLTGLVFGSVAQLQVKDEVPGPDGEATTRVRRGTPMGHLNLTINWCRQRRKVRGSGSGSEGADAANTRPSMISGYAGQVSPRDLLRANFVGPTASIKESNARVAFDSVILTDEVI